MIEDLVALLSDIDLRQAFKEINAFKETRVWPDGIVRSTQSAIHVTTGQSLNLEQVANAVMFEMSRRTYGATKRFKGSTEGDFIAVITAGNDYISALRQIIYPRNDDIRDTAWENAEFLGNRYSALLDAIKITETK